MALDSFTDRWEITTREEVEILLRAFEEAEKRGPYKPTMNVIEILEHGRRLLEEGFLSDK